MLARFIYNGSFVQGAMASTSRAAPGPIAKHVIDSVETSPHDCGDDANHGGTQKHEKEKANSPCRHLALR